MWRHRVSVLLAVMMTAVCAFLWVDSLFTVRRLPLVPFGDAALGLKSDRGWLSWNTFWLWSKVNPEAVVISVPYCAVILVFVAVAWRSVVVLLRKDTRFRWWEWAALGSITLSLAFLQGHTDPVGDLVQAIRNPRDQFALHEAYQAVDEVNRAKRGNDAAMRLIQLLDDNTRTIAATSVRALGKLHADPKLVVPALIKARGDKELRYFATISLGEIRPIDSRIVPALILSLRDQDPRICNVAASAVFEIGPAAEAAVPALIDALDDKPIDFQVFLALEKMGQKAETAVPALIKLSKTATGYDRLSAAQALWRIDQDVNVVVPALVESLKDPFLPIRRDAALALGEIGQQAAAAAPALIAARDYKPEPHLKRAAPQTSEAGLPVVEEMPEEDFYPQVRAAATSALAKILRRD
jgi:HEAT repeat protein